MRQGLFCLLLASVLFGCTSIPLSSIPKLSSLNPRTADLENFQVAVRTSEENRLYRNGATLEGEIIHPLFDEPRMIDLQLIPSTAPLTPFLEKRQKRGYRVVVFEVDPADAARINGFRQELTRAFDKAPGEGQFSITAFAKGCLAQNTNPFKDLYTAIYIRPDPSDEFFTLFKNTKVGRLDRRPVREDGSVEDGICTDEDEPDLLWTVD